MNVNRPVALVTGASNGLGAAMTDALVGRGWHVLAASRSARVGAASEASAEHLALDVTNEAALRKAVSAAAARGRDIELLVANAGINASALMEEMPAAQARAIVETNFWGVVHAARAVLPGMRQRRRGTVAVIGSLAGLVGPPGEAFYAASKHALEGFVESLSHEVRPFGIAVRLAEPGFIRTDLARSAPEVAASIADYAPLRAMLRRHWEGAIEGGMPADAMARKIVQWLLHGSGLRRRFGRDALWIPRLKRWLPEAVFMAGGRRECGIPDRLPKP